MLFNLNALLEKSKSYSLNDINSSGNSYLIFFYLLWRNVFCFNYLIRTNIYFNKIYYFRYFSPFLGEWEPNYGYSLLTRTLGVDSEKCAMNLVFKLALRKGRAYNFLTKFAGIFKVLKYLGLRYDMADQLEDAIFFWYYLPYKLSSVTRSNRKIIFPVPLKTFQHDYYFRKILPKILFEKHLKTSASISTSISYQLFDLLLLNPRSPFSQYISAYIEVGIENRMFRHFRWGV